MQEQNETQNKNITTKQKKRKLKFSLLTFVLLICIVELTFGAIQNITKTISFQSKIKGLENKKNEELRKNKQLKSEIENFNSDMILESIARNNLKMAGEDEVLLIINNPENPPEENSTKNNKSNTQSRP